MIPPLPVFFVAVGSAFAGGGFLAPPLVLAAGGFPVATFPVLVGSTAGLTGSLTLMRAAHTATKGGVIALTRQLAAEGAWFGIRVNCISPGMVMSPAT